MTMFSSPKCKLWARFIENGQWENIWNNLLTLHSPKICRRNLQQKLHLRSPPHPHTSNTGVQSSSNLSISPGKKAKLRKEYTDQVKDIQKLRDDATLTQEEFKQEKQLILQTLKSVK